MEDFLEFLPFLIVGGGFTVGATVIYGAWLLGRYKGRDERGPAALADVEARLQRLEQVVTEAMDAVDRLEAAHRFSARLLTDKVSERPSEPGAGRPPGQRPTTPH